MPRPLRTLALVAAGGAAAYLFDPRSGATRRRRVRELWQQAEALAPGGVDLGDLVPAGAVADPGASDGGAGLVARDRPTAEPRVQAPGTDTPTGTDPAAKYTGPGYEDVSFGQATARDAELVDRLVSETDGDLDVAARRFEAEAVGSQVLPPGR